MRTYILPLLLVVSTFISAQEKNVNIGPMVGYSQVREAMLWVQTKQPARVKFKYWPSANPDSSFFTNTVQTNKETAFTAKCIADSVVPGTNYTYELYLNNSPVAFNYPLKFQTLPVWLWRAEPPEFSFALGSCVYINEPEYDRPGKPYGYSPSVFEQITKKNPDFMLWLGDNLYFREADYNSRTGCIQRYSHDRAIPELQPLFASVHNYHIWDDHDFGPNNSDESYWMKDQTLDIFKLFTANPSYGVNGNKGITTYFNWNDVDYFLLDNRYFRNPNDLNGNHKTILGKEQLDWFKKALVNSTANFKFVAIGGQFLNTAAVFETYSNNGFAAERQEIIDFIYEENIKNVVFLTGDRHHTELSVLEEEGKPRIIDLTVSPLTSGSGNNNGENNTLRVKGTFVGKQNFGVIHINGAVSERKLQMTIFDVEGNELWTKDYFSEH